MMMALLVLVLTSVVLLFRALSLRCQQQNDRDGAALCAMTFYVIDLFFVINAVWNALELESVEVTMRPRVFHEAAVLVVASSMVACSIVSINGPVFPLGRIVALTAMVAVAAVATYALAHAAATYASAFAGPGACIGAILCAALGAAELALRRIIHAQQPAPPHTSEVARAFASRACVVRVAGPDARIDGFARFFRPSGLARALGRVWYARALLVFALADACGLPRELARGLARLEMVTRVCLLRVTGVPGEWERASLACWVHKHCFV